MGEGRRRGQKFKKWERGQEGAKNLSGRGEEEGAKNLRVGEGGAEGGRKFKRVGEGKKGEQLVVG